MIGTIRADTENQHAKIITDARNEAERILSEAQQRAESIIARGRQQSQREAEDEKTRLIASARLEGNRRLLEARNDILKSYEEKALAQLGDFARSPEYKEFLIRMVNDGVSKIGSDAIVKVNVKDKQLLKNAAVQISPSDLDSLGGAIISSKDGKRRVDNTIESIFNERRDDLRLKLSELVFGRST